eukprot:353234-Chlamydomonas_euryale.AAC.1
MAPHHASPHPALPHPVLNRGGPQNTSLNGASSEDEYGGRPAVASSSSGCATCARRAAHMLAQCARAPPHLVPWDRRCGGGGDSRGCPACGAAAA